MTTPNEREAVIAEMREEAAVQIKTVWIDRATFDRWIAALTREQRDGEQECPNCVSPWKCNGPHIGEAPKHGYGDDDEPQQEAPGAVAWLEDALVALVAGPYMYHHKMDEAAEREAKAFDRCRERTIQNIKTWCAMQRAMGTTPPAPAKQEVPKESLVDVRKVKAMLDDHEAGKLRPEGFVQGIRTLYELALLDGQQAGVDDAMVERAMEAADQVFAEKFGSRPVADETDTAMMRAALQAALGGGGRG